MTLNQIIKIMHFKKISLTIKEIPQPNLRPNLFYDLHSMFGKT